MARSPARIELTTEEEATLRLWLRQGTSEQRLVERARVILLSHEGLTVEKIAERLATRTARVSKWRQRFVQSRMAGLSDAPRSGKPNKYTEDTEKRVLKMLDESPPKGFSQWNGKLLAQALRDVSEDQVWRILRRRGIQLQRRRSWCITTDPEFGPKAADVVGLYLNPPENAVVICVDEKPHIQALQRAQGYLRLPDGKAVNGFSHCYKRHGTTTLFAALDVVTGQVKAGHYARRRRRRVPRLHEPDSVGKSGPGNPCDSRQPQYPQTKTGSLAQAPPSGAYALHADLQLMAESGRVLVQHHEPRRTARRQFHLTTPAARGHRRVRSGVQQERRPV